MSRIRRSIKKKRTNDNAKVEKEVEASQPKNLPETTTLSQEAKDTKDFPIVCIGASAGGLEAFTALLENLPSGTGMAFIFIQHLASGESMLTDILSRSTSMPVQTVKNNMTVEANNVYVIPPDANMTIANGVLHLQRKLSTQYRPIDEFLISLAQDKKNLAIGVILSGTGTDGTEGLKAIYAEGGITFAQDEETAKYPGMPHSAVSSGAVAFVLPTKKIAEELVTISHHPRLNHVEAVPAEKPEAPIEGDGIRSILSLLKLAFHVDFNNYKPSTINRRISRRMVIHKIDALSDYVKFLRGNDEELQALFEDMLINVTSFFREPETFQILVDKVLPEIMKNRLPEETIRIWVPGCASGEEAYSIAICLQEYFDKTGTTAPVQIFGTDINDKNIEKARVGIYTESITAEVSEARLGRFFGRVDRGYQIVKTIRDMCIFAKQDLVTDPPFSNLDVVSCRNVLIYFKPELQKKILPIFHYALKPRGFLILGVSESIGSFEDLFAPLDSKRGPVYIRKVGPTRITFGTEPSFELTGKGELKKPIPEKPLAVVQREVDQILMGKYVPPSVVVDGDLNIALFRGDIGPFLAPTPGEPSFNLLKMVKSELRLEVQTSIYTSRKQRKSVRRDGLEFHSNGHTRRVNIEVIPLARSEAERKLFMVVFEEASLPVAVSEKTSRRGKEAEESLKDRQIKELSGELAQTKESLQTIIEEQESTNEELRSALEEVQSSNEELQSTNEELETAKEELQSTNEELNTLNDELANRNREINRSINDLNNVFVNTNVAIIILDVDFKIRLFTPTAEKLFNLIPSDVGRPLNDIRLGLKDTELLATAKHAIENLVPTEREVQDESGHWYLMRTRPYLTMEKKIDGVVLSFVDITSLVSSRSEIESIAKFPSENPYPVIRIGKDGTILYSNPACVSLGEPICSVGQPAPRNWRQLVSDVLNSGQMRTIDEKYGDKVFSFVFVPIVDSGYVNVYGRDITERQQMEEKVQQHSEHLEELVEKRTIELKKTNESLQKEIAERKQAEGELRSASLYVRNLIEASLDPLVTISSKGKITDVNKATEITTGYSREELIGRDFSNYFTDPDKARAGYRRVFKEGLVKDYPLAIRHVSGRITDVLYNATVYRNEGGKIQGVFAAARDITERKAIEEKLKDSERLAAIGQTAGMVGHDLRNPLQSIEGALYLAKDELSPLPESAGKQSVKEMLEAIGEQAQYMNKIVADLQDFVKPMKPQLEEIDIQNLVDSALSTVKVPEDIEVKKLIDDVGKVVVDPILIMRVLQNLLTNAIQAMPKGGKLTVKALREDDAVLLSVSDTGTGISEEVKPKLFIPLFTTKAKGQGLGLAVCKRIIEAHSGEITYETEVGNGTIFMIRIPLQSKSENY